MMLSSEASQAKPLPKITELTLPFWQAAREGKLMLQFCTSCRSYQWYPRHLCEKCGSKNLKWRRASGHGEVYSYTVVRQVVDNSPAFESEIPFTLALIKLKEGPLMYSNILDSEPEDVYIGMKVQATFQKANREIWLPKFRPVMRKKKVR